MALPLNIKDLLDRKIIENSRIDYKAGWNPEPIIHTICAFANDMDNIGGGYIVIGVEEQNGMPVFPIKGLDHDSIDDINKDILQKLQSDPMVWNNFCQLPDLYKRIRIDTIQIKRNQPELFKNRLNKFIENTRKGLLYGEWNDNGRL